MESIPNTILDGVRNDRLVGQEVACIRSGVVARAAIVRQLGVAQEVEVATRVRIHRTHHNRVVIAVGAKEPE